MKKMALFFFSGTGNTYFVAKKLCDQFRKSIHCNLYSIEKHLEDANALILEADIIGLAFPVYGSSVPYIVSDFIEGIEGNSLPAFTICTQMMYSGDGAAYAGRLLKKKGFKVFWQEHVDMPNNISDLRILTSKRLPNYERIQERVLKKMDRFSKRILSGKPKRKGSNPLSLLLGLIQRVPFEAINRSTYRNSLRIDQDKCIHCGKCVLLCPVKHLENTPEGIHSGNTCTLCYRCINHCPVKAIYMISKKGVKHPYSGPQEVFDIHKVMKDDIE